jgi:hypothetical protein
VKRQLRRRFWIEMGLAAAGAALFLLTLLWNDWIEIVFRIDPDQGNGSLEWLIVGASLVIAATFAGLAGVEWRNASAAADVA